MPWVSPIEPFARSPRLPAALRAAGAGDDDGGEPPATIDGWLSIEGRRLHDRDLDLGPSGAEVVEITDSLLSRVRLVGAGPETEIRIQRSAVADGDLSGLTISRLRAARLVGCKLAGAEFRGSLIDAAVTNCRLVMTRLAGVALRRVAITDSVLDQADLFEAELIDVTVDGSALRAVTLDRARFERVDLRGAGELDLRAFQSLTGCLITPLQAQAMALRLADHAGLGLEDPDPGRSTEL